jgi:hypothetical protein
MRTDFSPAGPASLPSLIPAAPGITADYWCTWAAQNYLYGQGAAELDLGELEGNAGSRHAKEELCEQALFGETGWLSFFAKVRGDLIFLLDDGYYVGDSASCELDPGRFTSFAGPPPERLRKLNERVKQSGWRTLGLWLRGPEGEAYCRERLEWSRYADIGYWKVDGGDQAFNLVSWRSELHPKLLLEHVQPCGPFNGPDGRCGSAFGAGHRLQCLKHSDVLRIYDRDHPLSMATTLDRVASCLQAATAASGVRGIINCEDEMYVGAALGCSLGVFRSPQIGLRPSGDPDVFMAGPRQWKRRIDEVIRAVRWHRLAPPFAAGIGTVQVDDAAFADSWVFRRGETWDSTRIGRLVTQGAPARLTRGLALPTVQGGEPAPYVVASRFPNSAVAIAALARTSPEDGWRCAAVDVSLRLEEMPVVVGVFGHFRSLTLAFARPLAPGTRVLAQDLAGDRAYDVTQEARVEGQSLVLPGGLLERVGRSASTPGDLSDPGLVIKLEEP